MSTLPNMGQSPGQHFQFKQIITFHQLGQRGHKVWIWRSVKQIHICTTVLHGQKNDNNDNNIYGTSRNKTRGINRRHEQHHSPPSLVCVSHDIKLGTKGTWKREISDREWKPVALHWSKTTTSSQINNWNLRSLVGKPNSSRLLLQTHHQYY